MKISKPRVTGLFAGNSPVTGEFPAHMTSNAKNGYIWWRHHVLSQRKHDMDFYSLKRHFLTGSGIPVINLRRSGLYGNPYTNKTASS